MLLRSLDQSGWPPGPHKLAHLIDHMLSLAYFPLVTRHQVSSRGTPEALDLPSSVLPQGVTSGSPRGGAMSPTAHPAWAMLAEMTAAEELAHGPLSVGEEHAPHALGTDPTLSAAY